MEEIQIEKERILNHYNIDLDYLFESNYFYLKKILKDNEIIKLKSTLKSYKDDGLPNQEIVRIFSKEYIKFIRSKYREQTRLSEFDEKLNNFLNQKDRTIKVIWGDAYKVLRKLESESIQLMVTSPPYFNARAYSQWDDLNIYLNDMRNIIRESYRVLDNHRVWVFNVGDIFDNDQITTKSVWGKRRIPLGAYFIKIFEEEGFEFVDDIIWDKGEVESKRHMNNGINYPLYQYPLNCYEHLLIFHKHRLDKSKIPCPVCGSLKVNGNTQSEIGVQSWECKNRNCFIRSPHNRGKRFSLRTNLMQYNHDNDKDNLIDSKTINMWRRDIVKFPPVIKINQNGENILGHSAPFPEDIPSMAIKYFTYVGENVMDPFAGSFTVPIVAQKLNRVGIGIEINKDLFRKAILKRINNSLNVFESGDTFEEFDVS
ncbi:MAG: hypothetical protein A2X61_15820 [Ignavibacteria bacterium GWB2_35_12]|nr:MAG: hypothetical protein A2X63_10780 [Ignavibacteria bacterium GWA2_35_8]OGU40884.1 MAG: hypothetical protein A2X61_15820 [Ignavibacteria bacterium GWB2_35_12]OGU87151.1 MAG: hypothetical protein A2220_08195 [Ignavibacteria bacterium RIFOXYA2_FULL_35_10]OGV24695.1 MAG: hypothetical protein A2475_14595 [Ignavibacteria bacterium RIFOXYC2_FULL_35_21]